MWKRKTKCWTNVRVGGNDFVNFSLFPFEVSHSACGLVREKRITFAVVVDDALVIGGVLARNRQSIVT